MPEDKPAILFISFGGPEHPQEVMPFLERLAEGFGTPRERRLTVARHYEAIGGASPLNEITRRQADALRVFLRQSGAPHPVYVGQRHWHPFLEDTLRQMARDGVRRAAGFIAAPHRCQASRDLYIRAVEEARRRIGPGAPAIDFAGPWFDHPLFIEAVCERVKAALPSPAQQSLAWIFTAHSIPVRMAESSSYVQELRETARRVGERLGQTQWTLAYCSRSGKPEDPWLEPDVRDAIRAQAQRGAQNVLLIPVGFIADNAEVLFDLDVEAKEAARKSNVGFYRAATVGEHPSFIRMIADVIHARAAG